MGRKSNTKKKVRERLKETEEVELGFFDRLFNRKKKEKIKEEIKKEVKGKKAKKTKKKASKKKKTKKKEKKSLKEKLHGQKQNIFAGALTIIMLSILIAVGHLLFVKAFKPAPIAKFLPAEQTVFTVEFNLNENHDQLIKAKKLTGLNPLFSKAAIVQVVDQLLPLQYNDISSWLGRSAGLAIFNTKKTDSGVAQIYFFEISKNENLQAFLKARNASISTYKNTDTYIINDKLHAAEIGEYLAIAESNKEIFELIDLQSSKKLYDSSSYRRVDDNLPLNKLAYLFIDFEQVSDAFLKHFNVLSEQGIALEQIKPLLKVFKSEGIALIALQDNFAIQSFLNLNRDLINLDSNATFDEKYRAELANLVAENALVFWGGINVSDQINRFIEVLSSQGDAESLIFSQLTQSLTEKYFGTDVSFQNDILPLMDKEFVFSIEPVQKSGDSTAKDSTTIEPTEFAHKFVFHLDSPVAEENKIYELANNFATLGAIFEPKIVEHILADGTVSKELVAIPEAISKKETQYKEQTIHNLVMGKQNWGISYTIIDDIAVIATHEQAVKTTIDLKEDPKDSLRKSNIFETQISPVLQSADEVSFFKISQVVSHFFPEFESAISLSFDSLSSGRNYFNDGIVTIDYLKLQ